MPGMCGWCHWLDHAGLRYLVVMSAALRFVVVPAGDRAGSPRGALEARPSVRFHSHSRLSYLVDGCCPC